MNAYRETEELSMVDARRQLTKLPEKLESDAGTVAVTRRGKPVLAIMTWDDYESIMETLEILGDDDALTQLRESVSEVKRGATIPWEEARKRLSS